MSYSRIVLAVALQRYVDFPPAALRAREVAISLAKTSGAVVDVLTVRAPVALLPEAETVEEKLRRFLEAFRDSGVRAADHLLEGKPSVRIFEFAKAAEADLLLIGSHSKRGPLDVGLGNTAAALAKAPPCPLLMICPTEEEAARAQALMIPQYPFVFPYG